MNNKLLYGAVAGAGAAVSGWTIYQMAKWQTNWGCQVTTGLKFAVNAYTKYSEEGNTLGKVAVEAIKSYQTFAECLEKASPIIFKVTTGGAIAGGIGALVFAYVGHKLFGNPLHNA